MRITVLVAGLLLGAIMFLQTFLVSALGGVGDNAAIEQSGSVGLLMSFLWLIACAFVLPLPLVSVGLFVIAGMLGFAASGDFRDLAIWGGISLVLAVLSFLGWLGKRKERRTFLVEKARQDERDTRMETLLRQQADAAQWSGQTPCPQCRRVNPAGTRFCGNCGTALTATA